MGKNILNVPGKSRWDQGHFVHDIYGPAVPNAERGPIVRQVVLAPNEIRAKQWAQEARDAGFDVKTAPYGDDGLWCYERNV